jgi:hypothetical protein
METRNAYKILVNNFPGKRSLKYWENDGTTTLMWILRDQAVRMGGRWNSSGSCPMMNLWVLLPVSVYELYSSLTQILHVHINVLLRFKPTASGTNPAFPSHFISRLTWHFHENLYWWLPVFLASMNCIMC